MRKIKIKKSVVFTLILIFACLAYLYNKRYTFYDLRPFFYENIEIYEAMVTARLNTPDDEKLLSALEKKLCIRAKVESVSKRIVKDEISGKPVEIADIDFHRPNQSIVYSTRPEGEVAQEYDYYEKLADNWYYFYYYTRNTKPPPPYKKP